MWNCECAFRFHLCFILSAIDEWIWNDVTHSSCSSPSLMNARVLRRPIEINDCDILMAKLIEKQHFQFEYRRKFFRNCAKLCIYCKRKSISLNCCLEIDSPCAIANYFQNSLLSQHNGFISFYNRQLIDKKRSVNLCCCCCCLLAQMMICYAWFHTNKKYTLLYIVHSTNWCTSCAMCIIVVSVHTKMWNGKACGTSLL